MRSILAFPRFREISAIPCLALGASYRPTDRRPRLTTSPFPITLVLNPLKARRSATGKKRAVGWERFR